LAQFNKAVSLDSPLYYTAESLSKTVNISANLKQFKTILSVLSGPQVELFYENNGDKKSRDIVPLKLKGV
jgi:hypothetical protein